MLTWVKLAMEKELFWMLKKFPLTKMWHYILVFTTKNLWFLCFQKFSIWRKHLFQRRFVWSLVVIQHIMSLIKKTTPNSNKTWNTEFLVHCKNYFDKLPNLLPLLPKKTVRILPKFQYGIICISFCTSSSKQPIQSW